MHTECVLLLSLVAACSAFPSKHEELRSRNPNHYDDVRYVFVDEANVPNEFKKYIEEIPERLREHYGGTHLKFMRDRWHWQMVRARERAQGQDVRNSTHEEPVPAASASEGSSNNHQTADEIHKKASAELRGEFEEEKGPVPTTARAPVVVDDDTEYKEKAYNDRGRVRRVYYYDDVYECAGQRPDCDSEKSDKDHQCAFLSVCGILLGCGLTVILLGLARRRMRLRHKRSDDLLDTETKYTLAESDECVNKLVGDAPPTLTL